MTIEAIIITRYVATCDKCGRKFSPQPRKSMSERDLAWHECGVHRKEHDSTGGYRGILGGYNVHCVCGEHYVTDDPDAPFSCPKDGNL